MKSILGEDMVSFAQQCLILVQNQNGNTMKTPYAFFYFQGLVCKTKLQGCMLKNDSNDMSFTFGVDIAFRG